MDRARLEIFLNQLRNIIPDGTVLEKEMVADGYIIGFIGVKYFYFYSLKYSHMIYLFKRLRGCLKWCSASPPDHKPGGEQHEKRFYCNQYFDGRFYSH